MSDYYCEVYWGSHGCKFKRGHAGPHVCDCAVDNWHDYPNGYIDEDGVHNVGAPPYYGPDTRFYGDDAERLGLKLHDK